MGKVMGYYVMRIRNLFIIDRIRNVANRIDDAFERTEEDREAKRIRRIVRDFYVESKIENESKDEIQKEEKEETFR
ncbi:MAG: hypothetical protein QW735_03675 [archaeon]